MKFRFTLLLAAVSLFATCDKVPLTSPTGSTITIAIDRVVLPLNGQATVRAVVTEASGTPVHNGTMVTFQATIGTTNPVEVATVNGVATTTFIAGSISGKGTIKAFSGGATTTTAAEVTIGAAAAKTIAISATPSSVSQSGGTVTVSALVLDESGNPLPGVNVNFSATTGQLSPTTALTDAGGVARAQLTTAQNSTVTATAGVATKDVTVSVSTAPTVTIEAPATVVAGVPVAITVTTSSGTTAAPRQVQSLTVDFGDGTSETRTNVTGSVAFTHTYFQARGYTITATSTDVAGNTGIASRAIVVQPAVPTVSVSASPNSGTAPFTSTISGTASAATGGPPMQSVRVFINGEQVFSSSGGGAYSFAHRFGSAGTYSINAVATDTAGNESRASTTVIAQ